MSIDYVLNKLEQLENQIKAHVTDHPLEHHDHLLDLEEHEALHKPKERRAGEQRKSERRTDSNPYVGEERRSA